jgi:hypothetical protein
MGVRIIAVPYDSGQRARRLAVIAQPVTEQLVEHRDSYPVQLMELLVRSAKG